METNGYEYGQQSYLLNMNKYGQQSYLEINMDSKALLSIDSPPQIDASLSTSINLFCA